MSAAAADALETWSANRDPVLHLPQELVSATFRLLDLRDRIAVSHVSRNWRALALADALLWNDVDLTAFAVPRAPGLPVFISFLNGEAHVPFNPARHVAFPGPSQPKPPPHRAAGLLVEMLARSHPLPFALVWPGSRAPHDAVTLIAQNMRRMQALTLAANVSDIERLFEERAPLLRSFCVSNYSAWCALPARWDAPLLRTLEHARVPADMLPLPSVRSFACYALADLGRTGVRLFSLFPSLRSLKIAALMSDTLPALADPPPSLAHIDLRTNHGPSAEYGPLLRACARGSVRTLYLESAASFADALALFTAAVAGPWRMKLDTARACEIALTAADDGVSYTVGCARPLSLQREPRVAAQLARLASLTAHAQLLVELDALGGWSRALPALRDLTIHFAACDSELVDALPPRTQHTPIGAPCLEAVVLYLDVSTAGWEPWATGVFPEFLRSRFSLARPRLKSIRLDTWLEIAPEGAKLTALILLTECLRVHLFRHDRILEYGDQAAG